MCYTEIANEALGKKKRRERKPAGETRQPSVLENDRSESENKWEDLILGAHLEIIKGRLPVYLFTEKENTLSSKWEMTKDRPRTHQ